MQSKIKLLIGTVALAAAILANVFVAHATNNNARWYRFVRSGFPGMHVNIDGHPVDDGSSNTIINNDRIDATWPGGGCNPGPGAGQVGYIFVNDAAGNPIYHTDPTTGQSQNWYALNIGQGCESGSWTLNTSANPPYNPGQQYCPCQGNQQ